MTRISSDYTVKRSDENKYLLIDTTSGPVTLTLPLALGFQGFKIKKVDNSYNKITLKTKGGDQIENGSSYDIFEQYDSIEVRSDNASKYWVITGERTDDQFYKQIKNNEDFPPATGGVIPLKDKVYEIMCEIDIGSSSLSLGVSGSLIGNSPKLNSITSLTTGSVITTKTQGNQIFKDFSIFARSGSAIDLNGENEGRPSFRNVHIHGKGGMKIRNVDTVLLSNLVYHSTPLVLSGTINEAVLELCEFLGEPGESLSLSVLSGTIKRLDFNGCRFSVSSSNTGIEDANSNVSIGRLVNCRFTGSGTYTSGFTKASTNWKFRGNSGVRDSKADLSAGYFTSSALTFVASGADVYGSIPGNMTVNESERFSRSGSTNAFFFNGISKAEALINASVVVDAGDSSKIALFKNDSLLTGSQGFLRVGANINLSLPVVTTYIVKLDQGDKIELKMANADNSNNIDINSAHLAIWGNID